MLEYTTNARQRNRRRDRVHCLRWHGPRFVRGRRTTRLTTVWSLKPRRLATEVPA